MNSMPAGTSASESMMAAVSADRNHRPWQQASRGQLLLRTLEIVSAVEHDAIDQVRMMGEHLVTLISPNRREILPAGPASDLLVCEDVQGFDHIVAGRQEPTAAKSTHDSLVRDLGEPKRFPLPLDLPNGFG